jgi:hypothetical protein
MKSPLARLSFVLIFFIPNPTFSQGINKEIKKTINTKQTTASQPPKEPYFTTGDAGVIEALNWVRANPIRFIEQILLNPTSEGFVQPEDRDEYFNSLLVDLNHFQPIKTTLTYDPVMYESAMCHAVSSGQKGFVGHERQDGVCKENFMAECISYGPYRPIKIVCNLLIDRGVPSLGHRKILLSNRYTRIGVSTQPHATYNHNTVIDLR